MADEGGEEKKRNYTSSLVFGTDREVVVSESQAAFTEKEINKSDRQASHANAKYLRGKHWELGHDHQEISSTMRRDFGYKKASNAERTAAEILKKDLTKEHYHLGFNDDAARLQSTYHQDMGPASLYSDQPVTHEKSHKPPTSISLGTDANTIKSTSQAAYLKPSLKDLFFEDGKARAASLRKSNVMMGTDLSVWQTASSNAYQPLHGKPAEPVIRKTDVNVTFGNDNPKYVSEQQTKFSDVEALHKACRERQELDPALKADLRGSHFVFGTDGNDKQFESCSQAAFGEKEISTSLRGEQQRIRNAMKQVYMTLGNDRPVLTSCSKSAYVPPPLAQLREAALGEVRDERKRIMQKASYTLGTDGKAEQAARAQSLQSEDMRIGLDGVDYAQLAGLSDDVKADLRKHHFSFGIDGRTATTTSQAAYVQPPKGSGPGAMDAAVKADLRTHHFNFGNDDYSRISTTTQDQMVYHGHVAASLDPELKADLRAVHYVMGRDPIPKRSTYGDAFQYPKKA
jgi:hypothetical protein